MWLPAAFERKKERKRRREREETVERLGAAHAKESGA